MSGTEISDTIKMGLILLIMVFTFGTGIMAYNIMRGPLNSYIDKQQAVVNGADMETLIDLCTVNEVNGATVYTAMTQYGNELAGIVWEDASGVKHVYGSNAGSEGTLRDFLNLIQNNGFDKMYNVFRSEPVAGIEYQPQTMFIGVKEVR